MLSVINILLRYSKLDALMVELEGRPLSLHETLRSVETLMRTLAATSNLDFSVTIGANVPNSAIGDVCRLQQIVHNLIGNAVKVTKLGSVAIFVDLFESSDPNVYRISVRIVDTGIGMTLDTEERLFGPSMVRIHLHII